MDKNFILQKLNEALVLEQGIIEVERMLSTRSKSKDLRTAAEQATRDDETHALVLQRMIRDLGGQVQPPPMEGRAWIEALIRAVNVERDELDRLGLYRMLKFRAVAGGEVMDVIRRTLGNPAPMERLLVLLNEDRQHAARLAQLESSYAANEAVM
ncbi:MAG TPA: ferritin-like domain-containing protein [Chloroflexia bacterium]|nr:ferritin-like domain-containing protein [Chloroflexia bacterium]